MMSRYSILFAVLLMVSTASAVIDTSLPWHPLGQVADDSTTPFSVDNNANGIIDSAENSQLLDGLDSTDFCRSNGANCPPAGGSGITSINTQTGPAITIGVSGGLLDSVSAVVTNNINIVADNNVGSPFTVGTGVGPEIVIDKTNAPQRTWRIRNNNGRLDFLESTIGNTPFMIESNAATDTLYIDSANGGSVGIGTQTPSQKLDVSGQIHATGDICTDVNGRCLSTAGGGGSSQWIDAPWNSIYYSAGNVSIGKSTATEALDVRGSIKIPIANATNDDSGGIVAYSNDDFQYDGEYISHYGFGFHNYDDPTDTFGTGTNTYITGYYGIDFFTAGTPRVRISSISGNVTINNGLSVGSPGGYAGQQGVSTWFLRTPSAAGNAIRVQSDIEIGRPLTPIIGGTGSLRAWGNLSINNSLIYARTDTDRVGIGTTSPSDKLHIVSPNSFSLRITADSPTVRLTRSVGLANTWAIQNLDTLEFIEDDASPTRPFKIESGTPDNLLYLDSTGSVGIGTSSPVRKLTVKDPVDSVVVIDSGIVAVPQYSAIDLYDRGAAEWGIGKNPSNEFYISESSVSDWFTIEPGGEVGIGTSNPTQKLDVAGTAQVQGFKMPTGATNNYVLTSDASGVGTWELNTDCVVLEKSYIDSGNLVCPGGKSIVLYGGKGNFITSVTCGNYVCINPPCTSCPGWGTGDNCREFISSCGGTATTYNWYETTHVLCC